MVSRHGSVKEENSDLNPVRWFSCLNGAGHRAYDDWDWEESFQEWCVRNKKIIRMIGGITRFLIWQFSLHSKLPRKNGSFKMCQEGTWACHGMVYTSVYSIVPSSRVTHDPWALFTVYSYLQDLTGRFEPWLYTWHVQGVKKNRGVVIFNDFQWDTSGIQGFACGAPDSGPVGKSCAVRQKSSPSLILESYGNFGSPFLDLDENIWKSILGFRWPVFLADKPLLSISGFPWNRFDRLQKQRRYVHNHWLDQNEPQLNSRWITQAPARLSHLKYVQRVDQQIYLERYGVVWQLIIGCVLLGSNHK